MKSQITIYDKSGGELLKTSVTRTSIRKRVLMGDNYILLVFNHDSYIDFKKGSYIIYKDFKFEIMTDVYPEMHRNGWKYSLQFDAKDGFLRKYNIFYRKQDIQEVAFALTTDLLSFGNVICDCINHELGGTNWRVKAIPVEYADLMKTISFKGEKLFDALTVIAKEFECEWWTEENGSFVDLCFGKLSFGTEEEFEEGKVVTSIPRKAGDNSDFGTRFFVYGSTRNLTSDYGQVEQGGTTNHISEIRLRLPNGLNYIDAWENLAPEDVVHQIVFFDDIYPKNTDVITKVETAPREIKGSEETFDAYIITAENTPFIPSDIIEGETLGCVFETGALQRQSFKLKINYDPKTWKPSDGFDKKFEIIHVMNGDIIVPNKSFKPESGDKFVITGVKLPQVRINEAEKELSDVGHAWAKKKSQDTSVYNCPTDQEFCKKNEKNYDLGQKVRLIGNRFGVSGRSSRIQGYEKKLWNEYEAIYTVGDNSPYSRFAHIEGEIKESQYSERIGVVKGVGIYLIRNRFDNTQPTNYNAYSALASLEKFVTYAGYVNQPVRTIDDVKFKSIQTTNYLPGLTGTGARIDERGYAEMTGLTLREFLEVPELRFNRVDVVSGELWNAVGYGLIENVDVVNCIATLKLEEGELAGIEVNDICRGIFHNFTGNADGSVKDGCGFQTMPGFSTSYFTPVELLEGGKSFRYELKPGTTVHPTPAMKFAVYGNFTDKSRHASAYSTRTYKRYLKDVNTWEIDVQRNVAMQFGDLSGLYINGMSMEGYSAYLNNIYFSGYMQFTPGQLEEIKGKDGYSVNLTSYEAIVAVDSEGRIDSSVYDIINIVNGDELVHTGGSQVVTTRYKIQTEIEAYQGKTRLVYDETPGVGQYTAVLKAKGCEYAFAGGVLTITKITEDKASVEIEVNCEGAAVFTMTFTLTRVYGGVNADWPSYVFKQSEEKPEAPAGTDPHPTGWEDAPSSVGRWWMSKATISGITGLAGSWSDPVQVTAEDGKDGGYTDFKFAKNSSVSVGPELNEAVRNPDGWHDDPPTLLSGEFLWMTQAEIGGDGLLLGRWSDPVRVSGETGRPGDWPSYVFKQSESQPATPTSSSPQPDGWEDGPSSEGRWWMSKAMISGVTGEAGTWSLPVQVTGVDGQDGADGSYVYYEYAVNGSETDAPASGWSSTVPAVPSGQYLWMRWGTVYPPSSRPVSWTGVTRVTGERGPSSTVKMIFKYALDKPATPVTGTLPSDWLESVPERGKVAVTHGGVWTLKDGFRHSPTVAHGGISRNRFSFTTTKANQVVGIDLHVSSESGYDFALVGLLDNGYLDRDMNYTDRISGTGSKVVYVNVPRAGSHFIDVGYAKDSSGVSGQDKAWYQVVFPGTCWMSQTVVNSSTGYPGMWSDPVEFIPDSPDTESIYVRSEDGEAPDRPGNNVYGDDFVPALTTNDYSATVAYGVGAKVRSGNRYYKALKAGTGMPLSDGSSWKELPGWTDDPMGVSVVYRYEYMCKREKRNGVWGEWSDPKVFSHYAVDGANAVVVYKSSAEAPATPTGTSVPPHGWDVTPPERGTGEFLWVCSPVYDSEKKIIGWSVPSRFSGDKGDKGDKGDPGDAGLQGMICRVSEWAAGVYYRNDKDTVTDGLRYLDVVVVTNKDTGSFLCYEAMAAHNGVVSSEENKPENDTFWLRMTALPPVYTPLILAENGVIRFAQSNQLLIQQDDGTTDAGASGKGKGAEGVRFWAGSQNPLVAPWRVYANGKFVSGDADITGRITAKEGKIGGFNISGGSLEAISGDDKMSLSSSLITFKNDTDESYAYIGSDAHPGISGSALVGPVRLEVSRTSTLKIYGNAALDISVSGCDSSDGVGQQFTGNHALYIRKGNICGFRLRSRRVNSNETLNLMDSIIHCINSNNITLTLPSRAEDGQIYFIRKCAAGNININGRIKNGWGNTDTSIQINNAKLGIFIYDKANDQWTSNRADGF